VTPLPSPVLLPRPLRRSPLCWMRWTRCPCAPGSTRLTARRWRATCSRLPTCSASSPRCAAPATGALRCPSPRGAPQGGNFTLCFHLREPPSFAKGLAHSRFSTVRASRSTCRAAGSGVCCSREGSSR